jgi:hypothetical protein
MSIGDPVTKEVLDRVRRIETRLTRFMIEHGMAPPTEVPKMGRFGEDVLIPSMRCRLIDIVRTLPGDGLYELVNGGVLIGELRVNAEGYRQATTMPAPAGVASAREPV